MDLTVSTTLQSVDIGVSGCFPQSTSPTSWQFEDSTMSVERAWDQQLADQPAVERKLLKSSAGAQLAHTPSQAPLHNQSAFGGAPFWYKPGIQTTFIHSVSYSKSPPIQRPVPLDGLRSLSRQAKPTDSFASPSRTSRVPDVKPGPQSARKPQYPSQLPKSQSCAKLPVVDLMSDNSGDDRSHTSSLFSDLSEEGSKSLVREPSPLEQCAQGRMDALVPLMLSLAARSLQIKGNSTSSSTAKKRKAESLFVCSTCQREFTRRTILVNHERTHTGEKPFSCSFDECSQTFSQRGDKTRHEQAQHTKKTFRCGGSQGEGPTWGCGKTFRRKDGLLEHHTKTKKGKQCLADRDELM